MLAYPAVLHVTLPNGDMQSFADPQEAEIFLENLGQTDEHAHNQTQVHNQEHTPTQNRTPGHKTTLQLDRNAYYTPRKRGPDIARYT